MMWCKRMRCGYSSGEKIFKERIFANSLLLRLYIHISRQKRERELLPCVFYRWTPSSSIPVNFPFNLCETHLNISAWRNPTKVDGCRRHDAFDARSLIYRYTRGSRSSHGCAHIISVSNVAIRAEEGWRERRRRFVQPTKGVAARGLAGRSSAISLHHRSTLFSDGVDKEVIHIHALPRVPRGFWLLLPLVLMEPASFLSAGHVTRMFPTNWIYYPHRRQHSTTPSPLSLSLSLCIYIISMIFIHLDELCAAVSPTELCMQKSIVTRLARRLTTVETYTGKKSICACIFIATVSGKESNVMQSPPPKRFRWGGNWSFRLRVCDEREIPKR